MQPIERGRGGGGEEGEEGEGTNFETFNARKFGNLGPRIERIFVSRWIVKSFGLNALYKIRWMFPFSFLPPTTFFCKLDKFSSSGTNMKL